MRAPFKLALVAACLVAIALVLAPLGLPGYSHRLHPVALRGAIGLPWAWGFNAAAFLLPGACLVLAAARALRDQHGRARWGLRIGLTLVQLSALAFALQGVLPLDLDQVDAGSSRWHAVAWALWWIAFVPGALLLGAFARCGVGLVAASLLAAVAVPALVVLASGTAAGSAQRLGLTLWLGWWLWASWCLSRISASSAGSAPPART